MALVKGCKRCGGRATETWMRAHDADGKLIDVSVNLCQDCRMQAATENARAMSRRGVR